MQPSLLYKGLTLIKQKIIVRYKNPHLDNKDSAFIKNGINLRIIFTLLSRLSLPIGNLI